MIKNDFNNFNYLNRKLKKKSILYFNYNVLKSIFNYFIFNFFLKNLLKHNFIYSILIYYFLLIIIK
jgi:hypothetical protein